MPSRSKSSTIVAPQGGILLLEEYDALAAAIGSALKKFAPKHTIAIARSLADAEKLAAKTKPQLFVLDVDPPWTGLTDFLDKTSKGYPNARGLVIGAEIPREILAERGQAGALQFVEKPFELAAFGAAVQALLGPWREHEGRGTLGGLSVIDVVLAHCAAESNIIIQAQSRKRTGEIQIANGQIVHAATGRLKSEDALAEILSWSKPHCSERKLTGSARRTIANWRGIVLEALREIELEIPEEPALEPKPVPLQKEQKVVLIDDTEMLVIFVEDTLSTALPQLQVTTALNATDGLREIERLVPDLVLLDYSLPDFNGDELCRRLLKNTRTDQVPVLLMSGHVPEMNAAAARLPNVVAKIEKPFLSEALVDLVRRTLATEHRFEKHVEEEKFEPAAIVSPLEPKPEPEPVPETEAEPEPELQPEPPLPPPPAPRRVPVARPSPPSTPIPVTAPTTPLRPAPVAAPPPPIPEKKIAPPAPAIPEKKIPTAPPPRPEMPPTLAPAPAHIERHGPAAAATLRVAPTDGNAALLGVFLEVLSMQLTSELQMGAIRARPSSSIASLRLQSAATRGAIPSELGFQLGPAKLNSAGQISTLRAIPTSKPFQPAQMRTAFEIGGVALIPNETRARVQLTPAGTTPMTMQLFAHLELDAVELSANFQVAQLLLSWTSNAVRVTLNPKAPEQSAAKFAMRVLKLDDSGRISELLLSPIK